jgi:hypothetical protein
MRPGSNKRMRGRNRRGPNPLARSYESNGPDVKVRGTAQHIADRYLQLARDAQSSGDPVTAESYFQHAEHYLRIIAAAQDQMQAQYGYRPRPENGAEEEGDGEEGEGEALGAPYTQNGGYNGQPRQMPSPSANGPIDSDDQPPMFSPPRERFDNRNKRFEGREGWPRRDGNRHENRREHYRQDGHRREPYRRDEGAASPDVAPPHARAGQGEGSGDQPSFEGRHGPPNQQGPQGGERRDNDRRERFERPARQAAREEPAREEQTLPSFITAPVRPAPPAETPIEGSEPAQTPKEAASAASTEPETGGAAPRPRRGRPRRAAEPAADGDDAPASNDGTSPVGAK